MPHFHAIVWIDHQQARIFHFNASEADRIVVQPHDPARHLHHKANSIGSGHTAEDHDFLQRVGDAVSDAGAILITGPANAKTELVKHIERHIPSLSGKVVGVETLDHPTDGELVAHARKFFKSDGQMLPRCH